MESGCHLANILANSLSVQCEVEHCSNGVLPLRAWGTTQSRCIATRRVLVLCEPALQAAGSFIDSLCSDRRTTTSERLTIDDALLKLCLFTEYSLAAE